jgi:hypothetical protein
MSGARRRGFQTAPARSVVVWKATRAEAAAAREGCCKPFPPENATFQ